VAKAVVILPAAARALRRHRSESERILSKIEAYAEGSAGFANNVRKLVGSSGLRLRVGDYRVIFEETETEIIVTRIGPRGSIYD
jgi:mRNA interferase RelE/StbE